MDTNKPDKPQENLKKSPPLEIDYEKEMDNLLCTVSSDGDTIVFAHKLKAATDTLRAGKGELFRGQETNEWKKLMKMVVQGDWIEKGDKSQNLKVYENNRKLRTTLNTKLIKFLKGKLCPEIPENFNLFEEKARWDGPEGDEAEYPMGQDKKGKYFFKFGRGSMQAFNKMLQESQEAKSSKKLSMGKQEENQYKKEKPFSGKI